MSGCSFCCRSGPKSNRWLDLEDMLDGNLQCKLGSLIFCFVASIDLVLVCCLADGGLRERKLGCREKCLIRYYAIDFDIDDFYTGLYVDELLTGEDWMLVRQIK